jgi:hypothetical protein
MHMLDELILAVSAAIFGGVLLIAAWNLMREHRAALALKPKKEERMLVLRWIAVLGNAAWAVGIDYLILTNSPKPESLFWGSIVTFTVGLNIFLILRKRGDSWLELYWARRRMEERARIMELSESSPDSTGVDGSES